MNRKKIKHLAMRRLALAGEVTSKTLPSQVAVYFMEWCIKERAINSKYFYS